MRIDNISSVLSSVVENLFHTQFPKPEKLLKEFHPTHLPIENLGEGLKRLVRLFETPKTLTPMAQAPGDTGTKGDSGATSGTKSGGTGGTASLPAFVTAAEDSFFSDPTKGLNPCILFDKSNGRVEITMRKMGLDPATIKRQILDFRIMDKTDAVELSVPMQYSGSTYFLTVTKVMGLKVPTVTKIVDKSIPGMLNLSWTLVDRATADAVLKANYVAIEARLGSGKKAEDYLYGGMFSLMGGYGLTNSVKGHQIYDSKSGYYSYSQVVDAYGLLDNALNQLSDALPLGAALKVAYITIDEQGKAGAKGSKGPAIAGNYSSSTGLTPATFTPGT